MHTDLVWLALREMAFWCKHGGHILFSMSTDRRRRANDLERESNEKLPNQPRSDSDIFYIAVAVVLQLGNVTYRCFHPLS